MKQKLMYVLATLLAGGILVACGPGDETADGAGADGGVVEQPLGADPAADPAAADDAVVDMDLDQDANAIDAGAPAAADDTELDATAEGVDPEEAVADDAIADTAQDAEAAAGDAAADAEAAVDDAAADAEAAVDDAATDAEAAVDDAAADTQAQADTADEVAGGGAAAPAEGETVTVTLAQAGEGVAVEDVQGANVEEVAASDQENPDLNLTTGNRYEFVYNGEGELVFYDSSDQEILSTAGSESEFATNEEVNAMMEQGQLSFTLTEDLAQQIARYSAGTEDSGGAVNVN